MLVRVAAAEREWGGENSREAMLLHCANAHSGAWKGVAVALQDVLHLRAIDHLGHGNSPDWDGVGDFHSEATELARNALSGPTDLIGHSFGATVALRIAIENPELVRSLTMIEPVFFAAVKGTPVGEEDVRDQDAFSSMMVASEVERAAARFTEDWGAGEKWSDLPERQQRYIMERMPLVIASQAQIYHDRAGLLDGQRIESIACPVQLIHGAETPPVIPAICRALAARLDAPIAAIPGAAHMVPITHADPVAKVIRAFLSL